MPQNQRPKLIDHAQTKVLRRSESAVPSEHNKQIASAEPLKDAFPRRRAVKTPGVGMLGTNVRTGLSTVIDARIKADDDHG